jgi:MFS family permease
MKLHWGVVRLSAVVYFIQGALGIAGVATPIYLRNEGFSISKIAFIMGVATAPWFCKIFYGAISDGLPLWNLRRKPYLIICSILSSCGWVLLAFLPPTEINLICAMTLMNLGLAATDVITDGLVVENSDPGHAQTYQGISWGARSIGSVLAGVTGGILADRMHATSIFLITGFLPLISLVAAFFVEEKPISSEGTKIDVIQPIVKSVRFLLQGDFKWFCLLLLAASFQAAPSTPFFFVLKEELGFGEVFLGVLSSVAWLGAIIGCFVFLKFSQHMPLKKTLNWAIGVAALNTLLMILIRTETSAVTVGVISGVLGYIALLPLLSAAARLANATGVEGSLFAMLASFYNVGQVGSKMMGAVVYEWIGFQPLILMTACFILLGLLVVPRLQTLQ